MARFAELAASELVEATTALVGRELKRADDCRLFHEEGALYVVTGGTAALYDGEVTANLGSNFRHNAVFVPGGVEHWWAMDVESLVTIRGIRGSHVEQFLRFVRGEFDGDVAAELQICSVAAEVGA